VTILRVGREGSGDVGGMFECVTLRVVVIEVATLVALVVMVVV
jgi:hypothetical protein